MNDRRQTLARETCRRVCGFLFLLWLAGCASVEPRNPVPAELAAEVTIEGIPDARFWGDDIPPQIERRMRTMTQMELREQFPAIYGRAHNYLAISGGGSDGAFGAGLLVGWSAAGARPEFQMVTGVSTGALSAPWAFLGSDYDRVLREVYTTTSTEKILKKRSLIKLLSSDAAADSTPLLEMLQRYVDDDVVSAIAAEHRKGRRLYIGTTDLDHMRPVIWDIGAIAVSGHSSARELIQRIMLASASIPGAFPPVRFQVEAGGNRYDELHVDGGTTAQVFVYPAAFDWRALMRKLEVPEGPKIYVIRNSNFSISPQTVEQKLVPIASRSIGGLITTQGLGDLFLIYMIARRDGGRYQLAYIPERFQLEPTEPFDPVYMNALFELGYESARGGYPWADAPPYWEELPR